MRILGAIVLKDEDVRVSLERGMMKRRMGST